VSTRMTDGPASARWMDLSRSASLRADVKEVVAMFGWDAPRGVPASGEPASFPTGVKGIMTRVPPCAPGRDRGSGGAQRPASGAHRCPHGTAPGGVPQESRTPAAARSTNRTRPGGQAYRASSLTSHRRERGDDRATALRPGQIAARPARSAPRGGQKSAAGVWRELGSRPPY
jgi:hypothetical protein